MFRQIFYCGCGYRFCVQWIWQTNVVPHRYQQRFYEVVRKPETELDRKGRELKRCPSCDRWLNQSTPLLRQPPEKVESG